MAPTHRLTVSALPVVGYRRGSLEMFTGQGGNGATSAAEVAERCATIDASAVFERLHAASNRVGRQ